MSENSEAGCVTEGEVGQSLLTFIIRSSIRKQLDGNGLDVRSSAHRSPTGLPGGWRTMSAPRDPSWAPCRKRARVAAPRGWDGAATSGLSLYLRDRKDKLSTARTVTADKRRRPAAAVRRRRSAQTRQGGSGSLCPSFLCMAPCSLSPSSQHPRRRTMEPQLPAPGPECSPFVRPHPLKAGRVSIWGCCWSWESLPWSRGGSRRAGRTYHPLPDLGQGPASTCTPSWLLQDSLQGGRTTL